MHQTLIAVGALAITITFALSTQRSELKTDRQRIVAETQILAGQIATDMLTHISIQEFDAATVDRDVDDPNELTHPSGWGGGKTFAACDDVDDFHKMQTHVVNAGGGLDFEVEARVQYVDVDPANGRVTPSSRQTFHKEVRVMVRDRPRASGGSMVHTLPTAIELQQIVSMS